MRLVEDRAAARRLSRAPERASKGARRRARVRHAAVHGVEGQPKADGVPRRAEHPGGILHERQGMQDAQPTPGQIPAAPEGVHQVEGARGELRGHGVDREIAPPEVLTDPRGPDAGQGAGRLVRLGPRGGDVHPAPPAPAPRR